MRLSQTDAGMNLVVATSHSLLTIDPNLGFAKIISQDQGLYYGIAYSDDEIFVATRNGPVGPKEWRAAEEGDILVYDYNFELKEKLRPPFPLRDIHQIGYSAGELWVTCTFDDSLAIYHPIEREWEKWYPFGEDPDDPDRFHFNSVFFKEKELYLLAHKYGASEIFKCDPKARQVVDRFMLGEKSHNVWEREGAFYVCNSGSSSIENDRGFKQVVGRFPRGVAVTQDLIFIGLSEKVERSQRGLTNGMIRVFNHHFEHLRDIHLPKQGLVLEVRVPGSYDFANPNELGQSIPKITGGALPLPMELGFNDSDPDSIRAVEDGARALLKAGNPLAAERSLNNLLTQTDTRPQALSLYFQSLGFFPSLSNGEKSWVDKLMRTMSRYSGRPMNFASLLEIDYGDGSFLEAVSSRLKRTSGLGLKKRQAAKELNGGPQTRLAAAFSPDLPYPSETFDYVVCQDSSAISTRLPESLAEIHRVLSKTGVFLVILPLEERWQFGKLRPSEQFQSLEQWIDLFSQNGFSSVHTRTQEQDEVLLQVFPGCALAVFKKM